MAANRDFATRLRQLRKEKSLSLEQVAELLPPISPGLVIQWESGKMTPDDDLQEVVLDRLTKQHRPVQP